MRDKERTEMDDDLIVQAAAKKLMAKMTLKEKLMLLGAASPAAPRPVYNAEWDYVLP